MTRRPRRARVPSGQALSVTAPRPRSGRSVQVFPAGAARPRGPAGAGVELGCGGVLRSGACMVRPAGVPQGSARSAGRTGRHRSSRSRSRPGSCCWTGRPSTGRAGRPGCPSRLKLAGTGPPALTAPARGQARVVRARSAPSPGACGVSCRVRRAAVFGSRPVAVRLHPRSISSGRSCGFPVPAREPDVPGSGQDSASTPAAPRQRGSPNLQNRAQRAKAPDADDTGARYPGCRTAVPALPRSWLGRVRSICWRTCCWVWILTATETRNRDVRTNSTPTTRTASGRWRSLPPE